MKKKKVKLNEFFNSDLDMDLFETLKEYTTQKVGRYRKNSLFIFNKKLSKNYIGQSFTDFIKKEEEFQVFLYFAEQKLPLEFFNLLKLCKSFVHEQSKDFEEIEKYIKDPQGFSIPFQIKNNYQQQDKKEVVFQLYHHLLLQLSEIFYKQFFSSNVWEEYQKKKNEPPSKTVEDILSRPEELKIFKQFSQKEFNTENLEFMEIYKEFKSEKDSTKKIEKANSIYDEFVLPEGTKWLNIPEKIVIKTKERLDNGDLNCFDFIEAEVVKNLKDMYIRFTADPLWEEYKKQSKNKPKQVQEFYKIISLVEKGIQCEIYNGTCKRTNYPFHIVKKFYETEEELEKDMLKSVTKLKLFNLVSIEEIFREGLTLFIVVKKYPETLEFFLQKETTGIQALDEKLLDRLLQISTTVQYLQTFGRYFELGELCEENIYMSNLYTILYIDQDLLKKNRITYPFKTPEDFPTVKGDIFQLGLIFLRMIFVHKIQNISETLKKLSSLEKLDSKFIKLVTSMLEFNSNKRPDISKVIETLLKLYEEKKYKKPSIGMRGGLKNEKIRKLFKIFVEKETNAMYFIENVESFKKTPNESTRIWRAKNIVTNFVEKLNITPNEKRFIQDRISIQEKFKICLEESFDFLVDQLIYGELSELWDNFIESDEIKKNFQNLVGSEEIWV